MENPHRFMITHLIAPILYKHFDKRYILKQTCYGVSVYWGKDGILYSCNEATDIKRYICDVSYINKDNAYCRYTDLNPIYSLQRPEEIVREFYRAFLRFNIIQFMRYIKFSFDVKNSSEKFKKNQSLFIKSFYSLSTEQLYHFNFFFRII